MGANHLSSSPSRRLLRPLLLFHAVSLALVLLSSTGVVLAIDWGQAIIDNLTQKRLSIPQFTNMVKTEMDGEMTDFDDETMATIWRRATSMEWSRLLEATEDGSYLAPMVFCDTGEGMTGWERLVRMHELLLSVEPDVDTYIDAVDDTGETSTHVMYNGPDMTCAVTRLPIVVAADAALSVMDWFVAQPIVSLTKIIGNSVANMEKKYAAVGEGGATAEPTSPPTSPPTASNNNGALTLDELNATNFTRIDDGATSSSNPGEANATKVTVPPRINILLCRGVVDAATSDEIDADIATNQGQNVKDFLLAKTGQGSSQIKELLFGPGGFHNITAEEGGQSGGGAEGESRRVFWEEAFRQGIDREDGHCDRLIEAMDVGYNGQSGVLTLDMPTDEEAAAVVDETVANVAADEHLDELLAGGEEQLRAELADLGYWCGLSLLAGLAFLDTVCAIEVEPEMKLANHQSSWMMQSGIRDNHQFHQVGLDGTGQVVAVSDTGLDVNNCYFWDNTGSFRLNGATDTSRRKVVQYVPYINDRDYTHGHGTHVCGTVAGKRAVDGIQESNGMADGVAPGAKLAFVDIGFQDGSLSVPIPASDLLEAGIDAGCRLHSASWGSDSNDYGFNARTFDDYIYKNDNFLMMVAAGNDGRNGFNTVGDPATAKNIISVGASHSDSPDLASGMLGPSYIADFSSKGSTGDGRQKPDIVAPGKYILSAGALISETGECDPGSYPSPGGNGAGVLSMSGTSMATPGVSGIAAIVRQYFAEGWYPAGVKDAANIYDNPSGAAIKAVIMNGAQRMNGVDNGKNGIEQSGEYDDIQNFGRVSLIDSLYLPGKTNVDVSLFDRQTVSNGQTWERTFVIDKSKGCEATRFSVTLVWSDPPGSVGCRRCLVNDIDLRVTKANDTAVYFPNGRTGPDNINNAERVRLNAANGDEFTAIVEGTNLITSRQTFALVATGCFGGVANQLDTSQNVFDNDNSADQTNKTTKIIIGVVVGVVGAAIVGGAIYFFVKK